MEERPVIVLIEPHRLMREALISILETAPYTARAVASRLTAAAQSMAPDARVAIWMVDATDPEAAQADLDAARDLRLLRPELGLIAIAQGVQNCALAAAIEAAGVDAILSRDITVEDLVSAIHLVILGQRILVTRPSPDQPIANSEGEQHGGSDPAHRGDTERLKGGPAVIATDKGLKFSTSGVPVQGNGPTDLKLSERDRKIMRLLIAGLTNKDIAQQVAMSEATVKAHIKALLRKIGVSNRTQAAVWALNHCGSGCLDS